MNRNWLNNINLEEAIPNAQLGPAGTPGHLYFVGAAVGQGSSQDAAKLNDATSREFRVVGLLSQTLVFPDSVNASDSVEGGASYFLSPSGALQFETKAGAFQIQTNARNELSRIEQKTIASSIEEALHKFQIVVMPVLDHLSFIGNIPIGVQKFICFDLRNHVICVDYYAPYKCVALPVNEAGIPDLMLPIFALYREAKNSVSPYYRLFCYLKILEGLLRSVRMEVSKLIKRNQLVIDRRNPRVPSDPELANGVLKKYINQPIQALFESVLQKEFRNALAHFSLDDAHPWNLSDAAVRFKVESHLHLAEICCRELMSAELEVFEQIRKGQTSAT